MRAIRASCMLALLVLAQTCRVHAQPLFFPARLEVRTDGAVAFTSTDLNKDGLLDLASVDDGGDITVVLGHASGAYEALEVYDGPWRLTAGSCAFHAADYNGDGNPDLVIFDSVHDVLDLLPGDGAGGFGDPISVETEPLGPTNDSFLTGVADFNRDNLADLVLVDWAYVGEWPEGTYHNYVLLGAGDGSFSVGDILESPRPFTRCVIADFNEDGPVDVALSTYGMALDTLGVYLGDGTGKFPQRREFPIGREPVDLDVGDFNGDGHLDIVSGHTRWEAGWWEPVNVLIGAGDGTFAVHRGTPLGEDIWFVAGANLNEDSILDLVVVSFEHGTGLMMGTPDAVFAGPEWYPGGLWADVLAGDLSNDGHQDLIVHSWGGISVLYGAGEGTLQTAPYYQVGLNACSSMFPISAPSIVAADFDSDGDLDLAATNPCSRVVSVLEGVGDGRFETEPRNYDLPGHPLGLATADMNEDQHPDLVISDSTGGAILTLLGDGVGGFGAALRYTLDAIPGDLVIADFDEDDDLDAAVISRSTRDILLLLGDGSGSFLSRSEHALPDSGTALTCADFNEDGHLDLAVGLQYPALEGQPIAILLGTGTADFTPGYGYEPFPGPSVGLGPTSLVAADFNEDGHQDVALLGAIFLGDGEGAMTPVEWGEGAWGVAFTTDLLARDVNADAHLDLVLSDFGSDNAVMVFLGRGDATFEVSPINYGLSWIDGALCSGDFNSDGTSDLAVCHPDTHVVSILLGLKGIEHDIALLSIESPKGEIPTATYVTPQVVAANRGRTSEAFGLRLQIGEAYDDTVQVTLEVGQQLGFSFQPWLTSEPGAYQIACTVLLDTDQISSNNVARNSVIVTGEPGAEGPIVSSVTPSRGGDGGWITALVEGSDFQPGATVSLRKEGQEDIPATGYFTEQTEVLSPEKIQAVFNLQGTEEGAWDLVVTNPDNATFTFGNAFTVEPGDRSLWVDLTGKTRFVLSAHAVTNLTYDIYAGNSGNFNLDYVVLELDIPDWLVATSIVYPATGDTLLHGDSLAVHDKSAGVVPFWVGVLTPGEIQTFQLNVRGDWWKYRDLVIRAEKGSASARIEDEEGPGIGLSGLVLDSAKCFGKNLAEAYVERDGLELQDFENAGEQALGNLGESLFWSGVTLAVEILFPWTIPFIEAYSIAQNILGMPEAALQMARLAFEFLMLFAEWYGDPNFKAGPTGYGEEGYITDGRPYLYQIHFENVDTATAAVPYVIVVDTLDQDLDWSTFSTLNTSHALTSADLDSGTGEVRWRFDNINLPPNKNPPEGEGWLTYSIWPKAGLPSGTQITNRAYVIFGTNEPEITATVLNTIDNLPPESHVLPLEAKQNHVAFQVEWAGLDTDSGIYLYRVFVAEDDAEYSRWLETDQTRATFVGHNGHTYSFHSVAVDHVGHEEARPDVPDAVTTIDAQEEIGVTPNPFVPARGHTMITFFGGGLAHGQIKIYTKAGQLVRTLRETDGGPKLEWDATNQAGEKLASGVYIWVLSGPAGGGKGKFGIIK